MKRYPIRLGLTVGLLLAAMNVTTALAVDLKTSVSEGRLHVEASPVEVAAWANTQLLIDTDGDSTTGYQGAGAGHGYDLLVEGSTVYHFKGTDSSAWAWDRVGTAKPSTDAGKFALDVDLKLVAGNSAHAAMLLRGISSDFKVLATVPADGPATVDLSGTDTSPTTSPAASALSATAAQDGGDVLMKITAASASDLNTVLVFFDTDADASTGFSPPADPHFGFELMLQGGSLSQHTGGDRGAWSWSTLSPVKQEVTGKTETLRFNAALLKSDHVKWSVWQMSPDWQVRTGAFPHTGGGAATAELTLDAAQVHADAGMVDVPMAAVHANASLPPRERFKQAKTYSCYYGAEKVAPLSHLDAAILHIPAQTPATVKQLNDIGVVTIGYISIGEDETLRAGDGTGPGGKASWYFDTKHKHAPDENGVWGSYFANANDPAWRADRVQQAKHLTGNGPGDYGFVGIFLDTVDTVDAYPESHPGMVKLITELRAAIPDKVIVMNRGFTVLKDDAVDRSIDGLMFEDFSDSYDFNTKTYFRFDPSDMDSTRDMMVKQVMPVMKKYGIKVMALDYITPDRTAWMQEAVDRANTFGMMSCISDIALDAVYDTWDIKPRPDPKFFQTQSSPDALKITLDTARDGFPAGTTVTPSSTFMGYRVATVVDGIVDRTNLDWSKQAWASAEQPDTEQSLSFELPKPVQRGALKITFATDNGQPHASRNFSIMVRPDDHSAWQTIASPSGQDELVFSCPLPAAPVQQIHIVQSVGGGSASRPDLMWVQQVQLD